MSRLLIGAAELIEACLEASSSWCLPFLISQLPPLSALQPSWLTSGFINLCSSVSATRGSQVADLCLSSLMDAVRMPSLSVTLLS